MQNEQENYQSALSSIPYSAYHAVNAVKRASNTVMLSAILPVYQESSDDFPLIMLMRPEAKKPNLPPPLFQLCKGTRMTKEDGSWHDITAKDLPLAHEECAEPLAVTALREGHEEIGLRSNNIITLASVGVVAFISSSTSQCKYMALHVAAIKDPDAFDEPSQTLASTAERRWIAPHMTQTLVKQDHGDCIIPALRAVGFDL